MGLIISVSGIRGIVGTDLKVADAMKFGMLFGESLGSENEKVILAGDSRVSGPAMRSAIAAGLMAVGKNVIDLGIVTTPGGCLMVREMQAAGAVIVTASHNPFEWNGIKMIGPDGLAYNVEKAATIKEKFFESPPRHVLAEGCGTLSANHNTHSVHIEKVLSFCDSDLLDRIKGRRFKVVLDSINGAGCVGTAKLLEKLGCDIVHINNQPTGRFAHTPEPIEENLHQLTDSARSESADIGFAQDPDADRLVVVDENGRFIGEEYTLVLASWFVLKKTPGPIAVNLSTSRMIDDLAEKYNQKVLRTPVGEANVARSVIDNNSPIGGEGNGGVIFPKVVPVRDSFSGIVLILQLMAETGQSLSQLVSEIPKYEMIKTKFPCDLEEAPQRIQKLAEKYSSQKINTSDGLRIDWPEKRCWVHIRSSNTEPIVRIIAESPDKGQTAGLIEQLANDFEDR